ncbi:MAG TPA: cyclopropane-fatty-acyl-phospholipid synthase family protein [Parvularculaceae bacterium]|nr:cyclopropane-fatty-acyl-phospholipid synthase family protein [Parvularculaceae bacterium]
MTVAVSAQPNAVIVTPENRDLLLSGAPLFFRLVCNLTSRIKYGAIVFVLPDGRALKFVGSREQSSVGVIVVKDYAFARRSLVGASIGFFESFADDEWDTPDLAACLYVFARNADYVRDAFNAMRLARWFDRLRHNLNANTRRGARRNIIAHYDLGNAFYEQWLDRTMTYSSALFPSPSADLAAAQLNKYEALARRIDLKHGEEVLEIGSGWGGFAEHAAKRYGAKVTGLTISPAQFDYARRRIFEEGLAEKVDIRLEDYRDVEGRFDKIASIEMFEAVGEKYWPAYFSKIREVLKPGGLAGLQVITIADRFFQSYRASTDFIQKHVFPGGMLPSPSALKREIERAGLVWRQAADFGEDYAKTLREWHERFLAAWDDIKPLGFDERFKKLWRFYLSYCEAGFRAKTTDVYQIAAARG